MLRISLYLLMVKAEDTLASPTLLHQADGADGAYNRAYYAKFDAAKAVLLVPCRKLTHKSANRRLHRRHD